MKHWHHIVPKHRGGSDSRSNLIELTVQEHALWHWCEWKLWGNEYDRVAWLSLSGQIELSVAQKMAQLEGARRGGEIAANLRTKQGNTIGQWNKQTGHVKTIATVESCAKGGSVAGRQLVELGKFSKIQAMGAKAGGKAAAQLLNRKRVQCLECGMVSTPAGIGNHQKASNHKGKAELVA